MDKLQIERVRDRLQAFDFKRLFIEELGWSHARGAKPVWDLGPDESGLQSALIEGWAVAAQEQAHASPDAVGVAGEIRRWQEARQAQIAAGRLRIRVGHQDALLFPLSRLPDAIDEGRSHPSDPSPAYPTAWRG